MLQMVSLVLVAVLVTPEVAGNGSDGGYPVNREVERRRDNFRLPLDMSFDPKFWPTRGRRSQWRFGPNSSDLAYVLQSLASQECLRLLDPFDPTQQTSLSGAEKHSAGKRQKKSPYGELADFLWGIPGNRLWKPDLSSYQEKEKKENVFWVTRGRRSAV